MWIRHKNGVVCLVYEQAHITRLLNDGGYEVPDPTRVVVQPPLEPDEPMSNTDEMPVVTPVTHAEKPRKAVTRKR